MLAASSLLRPLEAGRARAWEKELYAAGRPVAGAIAGFGGIAVLFAWINLAIADFWATGDQIVLFAGRVPARDLTLSIAWGVYALVLLGVGMSRDMTALRWISLSFLVLTILKVFLYDLGELRDLYRVASLVGLAASLILVSLLYARFVFRREKTGQG